MSKQASIQSSSFSIRFRPAAVTEHTDELGTADDICDINSSSPSHSEAVQFERLSNAEEQAHLTDSSDSRPVPHPNILWKNSQAILSYSAPASELTSPVSPAGTALPSMHEKVSVVKPLTGSPPLAEKLSIFSGLKEKLDKLSMESKEIFDRKMKRSGSADSAKIASLLAEVDVSGSKAMSGVNAGLVATTDSVGQQPPDVNEASAEGDSTESACNSSYVCKSTSCTEVTKADIASLGNECGQEPVVMSRLLSSTSSQSDNRQYVYANILQLSKSSQNVNKDGQRAADGRRLRNLKRFISTARFRCLLSFLVAAVAYVVVPMPPYVAGMLIGAFLSALSILCYQRLTGPRHSATVSSRNLRSSASITADIRQSKNVDGKFQVCKILDNFYGVFAWIE